MHNALLIGASFLASTVEMVEAMTIILAVGVTRGWRSSLLGVGLMLMSFGTFWGGEGVGIEWTLKEGTILVLIAFYWVTALGLIAMLRSRGARDMAPLVAGGG